MRYLLLIIVLALLYGSPTLALASHSLAGGAECGTFEFDAVADMTKGRTDGMVSKVDHTVVTGQCSKRVILKNLVGTGLSETYGYSGQGDTCVRLAQAEAANTFRYYFDTEVDPASIKVICSRYSGPD